jgi:DNA polymerase III subunit delta
MTHKEVIADIKKKIYKPVYLLVGEEPYNIDVICDYIEQNVLTETEKGFNQTIFYGKDSNFRDIILAARRYPMMSNHQVIIIKEAQDLKDLDQLAVYAENPLNSTILVICQKYKKPEKTKKLYKAVSKTGIVFESAKIYDNKISAWVDEYLKDKNLGISPAAGQLIADFLGNDLSKIANELNKLIITIPADTKIITPELIEKNIGISKEYNNIELQKAIGNRDVLKANRIIDYFAKNPKNNSIIASITILYSFFCKLLLYHSISDKSKNNVASILGINPFFVSDYQSAARNHSLGKVVAAFTILREYDLKAKGMGNASASDGELLKEMIFKLIH